MTQALASPPANATKFRIYFSWRRSPFFGQVVKFGPSDTAGNFDLIGGQADLYNFAGGTSEFGTVGTVATTQVPEPSLWGMMI